MPIIGEELAIFMQAVITGVIVCGSYYLLVILRNLIPHSIVIISIEDIIFWIWTAIYIFIQMYTTSYGSVRWYFILGVVVGVFCFIFLVIKAKKVLDKWGKTR